MRALLFCLLAISLFSEEKMLQLPTGPLSYAAEIVSLPLSDKEGKEIGQLSSIAYTTGDPKRPITFVFNGGPGSSSVWLHLGAFGPKRVLAPEEGQSITPPYALIDNSDTLLDLTDLVFIDPVSTGLSRTHTSDDAKPYYDVDADIQAVGNFIRDFLAARGRWNCPLYIAGESYGTSRAAGLANYLQSEHGIYPNGLILISCALDFQTFWFDDNNLIPYFLYFPTYVATAWHHGRYRPDASLEEVAQEAIEFAYNTYAPFLFRPHAFDKAPLFEQLAAMTGLPLSVVQRADGKPHDREFFVEFFPGEKKTLGRCDTRSTGRYTYPHLVEFAQDPSSTAIMGIFSTALYDYLHRELNSTAPYKIISEEANSQWQFLSTLPCGFPNFMNMLRNAITANPSLKIFVGSGYFDAATPFAATEYCLNHLDCPHLQSKRYEGGHMYYLNPKARTQFKQDLMQFYGE